MQQTVNNLLNIRGRSSSDVWDFENAFYWFSHQSRLNKLLAHYDLYQSIVDLPGDIFELGVYKAASLIRFASFRNTLENDTARRIVGFDAFGAFPSDHLSLDEDRQFIESFEAEGGNGLTEEEVAAIIQRKGFGNIHLRRGNVFTTLNTYLTEFPASRIALLHLDMDVKEPTAYALDLLYDRVVPGGLIVLDDYVAVAGASVAVDYFVRNRGLTLQKTRHYTVPAYIRKPT